MDSCKLYGCSHGVLQSTLNQVEREISGLRDEDIDRWVERLPHYMKISRGRDQAWFIYSLLDEYNDVDEWKEVVEKKLQIKAIDVTEVEKKFPNNFREQKYQIFHLFCRSNGLDTLDAMIAGTRDKGLKVPPRSRYARRNTSDAIFHWAREKRFAVLPLSRYLNLPEVDKLSTRAALISNEGLSKYDYPLSVGSSSSSGESGYSSASITSSSELFDETTDDPFRPIFIRQTQFSTIPKKSEATNQLRLHTSLKRSSDEQSFGELENRRSSSGMIDVVREKVWLECMQKLEFPETRLQEMYTSSFSEKDSMCVDEASEIVGPSGAVLKVGGCKLIIPEGALDANVTICITTHYDRDAGVNRATPLLKCEPHGLRFNKEVEVILPTCYLTDGSVSVTAKVRRSEDGKKWKTIKLFDYRIERCFKFSIRGFSWYDVILETLFGVAIEKLIVCCIPEKYSDDPKQLVIVCNIFDAVLEHKQQNCTDLFQKSIALRKEEPGVSFQLVNKDIFITSEERTITDARATKVEQAQFCLAKWKINMLYKPIQITIKTATSKKENEFFIFKCAAGFQETTASTPAPEPSDSKSMVVGKTVSGTVVGCEKVNYAPHYHYHYDGESAKQIAPPSRDSIENGRVDDRMIGGASAGTSNDALEVFPGHRSQDAQAENC